MLRLFVGLAFPDQVRASLDGLCHGVPGVRWVRPETFHMTLRFIGEVSEDVAEDLDTHLCGIHAPRFSMRLQEVGCFDSGRKVRALWAGAERTDLLAHLQGKVESAAVRSGLPAETRKFKPHVTLGRAKDLTLPRAAEFLESRAAFQTPEFDVESFILFRSHLGREGAHYDPLAEYPLV